jgi:hypothetical protein
VIDSLVETLLPLADAAKFVPPGHGGKRTHLSTLLRWICRGARGPKGERVYLEALRAPRGWLTSREALQRFLVALTPTPGELAPTPRTPGQRQRASDRAAAALERAGI